jgi:hypothetical protein
MSLDKGSALMVCFSIIVLIVLYQISVYADNWRTVTNIKTVTGREDLRLTKLHETLLEKHPEIADSFEQYNILIGSQSEYDFKHSKEALEASLSELGQSADPSEILEISVWINTLKAFLFQMENLKVEQALEYLQIQVDYIRYNQNQNSYKTKNFRS